MLLGVRTGLNFEKKKTVYIACFKPLGENFFVGDNGTGVRLWGGAAGVGGGMTPACIAV